MKTLKAIVLSTLLVVGGVSNAHAMGDREQAALLGAGAVVLLSALFSSSTSGSSGTTYEQAPVYYEPAPTVVYTQPYYAPVTTYYVSPRPMVKHHHEYERRYDNYPHQREFVSRGYH